ncbi:NAD(P)-dependent oxidoreductase [Opitutales bacterium]|nr:NAD(P)-dependent oxidoreductase [Opitutales bacterium]
MKILITGGAGYLGSIIVPKLLNSGHQVTVLDNLMFRQATLSDCCIDDGFNFIHGDCRSESVMSQLMPKHDLIIPLAALVGAPLCDRDVLGATSINSDSVSLICKLASKSQRIIMPVTNSGYGIGEAGKFCTEETPLRPISLYGKTKVDAEKAVLDFGNCITFRLATVFGMSPRMRIDLLVNDFVYRAVNDKALVIFQGHFKRNFVHVRDVADAFVFGIENFDTMKGQPFNLGLNNANLSKLELCEEIKKEIPNFVFIEAPIGEDIDKRDYIVSNDRLKSAGFEASYSLQTGIRELIKGYSIFNNRIYGNV